MKLKLESPIWKNHVQYFTVLFADMRHILISWAHTWSKLLGLLWINWLSHSILKYTISTFIYLQRFFLFEEEEEEEEEVEVVVQELEMVVQSQVLLQEFVIL